MKKLRYITVAAVVALCCAFAGCGSAVPVAAEKTEPSVSAEQADTVLKEFLHVGEGAPNGTMGNRTPSSPSEKAAADWLAARYTAAPAQDSESSARTEYDKKLTDAGVAAVVQPFDITVSDTARTSQNVIISVPGKESGGKRVIVGANYDNLIAEAKVDDAASGDSLGAMSNATGVAAVVALADYYVNNGNNFGFDLEFVFFGSGTLGSRGSLKYLDSMTVSQRMNTLLMVNIQRLGAEKVYIYSDEVESEHNEFLRSTGADTGRAFYEVPKSIPIIETRYTSKVPYVHYAMMGDHAPFWQDNVPVANIFGADIGTFYLSNVEISGSANLGGTASDNYTNLKQSRPNYAQQISDVCTLVTTALLSGDFVTVMNNTRTSTYDYGWAVKPVWAQLGVVLTLAALAVLLVLLVRHFEKKYPYKPIVKKLKVAVFGMDYENPSENGEDVYVDIKKPRNPFDGY